MVDLLTEISSYSDRVLPILPVNSIDRESNIFDTLRVLLEYLKISGVL